MGDQQARCGAGLALVPTRAGLHGNLWKALVCAHPVTLVSEITPSIIHQTGREAGAKMPSVNAAAGALAITSLSDRRFGDKIRRRMVR